VKSLRSTNLIASLEIDPYTFTGLVTHLQRLKSGRATRLTVKTLRGHILMTVELSQSSRDANPGGDADAAVYFLHRDDREPTRVKPSCRMAI
jgi:hypothetical protein